MVFLSRRLKKLQRVQNTATHIVTKSKKFDHIMPILKDLHWLSIAQRINYKIVLLTFKALHNMARQSPQYISDLLQKIESGAKDTRIHRSDTKYLLVLTRFEVSRALLVSISHVEL